MTILTATKISRRFQAGDQSVTAVSNVNISIDEGQFVSIIGKSGSGKSTLLALLGALDQPSSGQIRVDGQDITKLNDRDLTKYRCGKIGFVFQHYNLIPNLSALDNVMLPMEFSGLPVGERQTRAVKLLESVGLSTDKHDRRPSRLSGGEQQRVAIARALANQPKLILADEPTGNLDSQTGKMIFDLLHQLSRSEKTTIIVVTHDLSIAGKTDLTFKLQDGRLVK